MSYITPKTDWVATDKFNISDYNRIKNNLNYLHEKACLVFGNFTIEDMGADISAYTGLWNYADFNKFENNLDTINQHMLNEDIGVKKTFYGNSPFITYEELNRIEGAVERMNTIIEGWYEGLYTLEFTVGRPKGIYRS